MRHNTRRGRLALVLLLSVASFRVDPAAAEVRFQADFETGDFSQFGPLSRTVRPGDIAIDTEVVHSGKYAGRFTIHEDDVFNSRQLRAQAYRPEVKVDEGSDTFVSFYILMKEPPQDRDNFFYWEGSPPPRYYNVMTWWVEPMADGSGTAIKYGTGNLGRNGVHWEADFVVGQWHQLGMHIHWSEDPAKGNVRLWWDGELVLDKPVQTKEPQTVCSAPLNRGAETAVAMSWLMTGFVICSSIVYGTPPGSSTPGRNGSASLSPCSRATSAGEAWPVRMSRTTRALNSGEKRRRCRIGLTLDRDGTFHYAPVSIQGRTTLLTIETGTDRQTSAPFHRW